MLVEDLKTIVADLFKQSEDAVPVLGDGNKKEWMAYHLDNIIDEDGDALQCLLKFDLITDVIAYLENEYKERKDEDHDPSLPCEMQLAEKEKRNGIKQEQHKQESKTTVNKAKKQKDGSTVIAAEKRPAKSVKKGSGIKSSSQNKTHSKASKKAKEHDNDPILIIEEEIIIVRDGDCGC